METLQNFIFPENEVFGSQEKYFRSFGDIRVKNEKLQMNLGSSALFDTYYNAFSLPLWLKQVGLSQASLWISGKGKLSLELCQLTSKGEEIVDSGEFDLTEKGQQIFELTLVKFDGLIYPRVTALSDDVEIVALTWKTVEVPRRRLKLGISITTFNRKNFVMPAIRRIKENLLDHPDWRDKIDFTVVDNASNLTEAETQGVTVITNENTGGSGGFMRGFLHYKNDASESKATHVLFMDDDAALEVESIKRAYQILQFAKAENTAVGAALFYDNQPDVFLERGASLGKYWVTVEFQEASALDPQVLLASEKIWEDQTPNTAFMGWWFCAFPISAVKSLVPPFFVRSDDMAFTQLNKFNVVYANGIASYAEDFQKKMSPMTVYLDARNMLLYYALFPKKLFWIVYYIAMNRMISVLAARYEHSHVERLALNDFLKMTPSAWVKAAGLREKLPEVNAMIQKERLKSLDDMDLSDFINVAVQKESTPKSLLRMVFQPRHHRAIKSEYLMLPNFQQLAGAKRILYYLGDKGFIVTVSLPKMISGLFLIVLDSFRLLYGFGRVRRRMLAEFDYLTSEKMWQEIFSKAGTLDEHYLREDLDDRKPAD